MIAYFIILSPQSKWRDGVTVRRLSLSIEELRIDWKLRFRANDNLCATEA